MRKILLLLLLIVLVPAVSCQSLTEVDLMVPAVGQDPSTGVMFGVPVRLNLRMMSPGNGEVFVNTRALTEMDMQGSARVAAMVAEDVTGEDMGDKDFLITLYANSTIIGGPSAGASITVGMIALLEELELRGDVMMTGMITPDGAIGVVGGIPEKAHAASISGVDYFLIPEGQSTSYNSTDYEDVNVTELARERWNITVVEVSDIREAVSWFTEMEFKPRSYPSSPVATESYQDLMRLQSGREIEEANMSLAEARSALNLSFLNSSMIDYLGSDIQTSADRLTAAQEAYEDSQYYVASSKAFQSKIYSGFVSKYVTYLSAAPEDRLGYAEGLWQSIESDLSSLEDEMEGYDVRGISGLECFAAVQSRIDEAEERVQESREWFDLDAAEMAMFEVSFASERTYTAALWLNITRFYSTGPPTSDTDLREMAENIYSDASILATYADMLYQEIFGLPLDFVAAYFTDYSFIDPYEPLDASERGMRSGDWAMATFQGLESEVRSGLAIEFINVLILAEDNEEVNSMLTEMSNRSRRRSRLAIKDSRNIGVEPVLSVSRFEFSEDLSNMNDTYALGEAIFGYRFSETAARLSPGLLGLYSPKLKVDVENGTVINLDWNLFGVARDPNGDEMDLQVSIGDLVLEYNLTTGPFEVTLPTDDLADGRQVMTANLSDGYLFQTLKIELYVDNGPPLIELRAPRDGVVYGSPLSLDLSVADSVDPDPNISVVLDGRHLEPGEEIGQGTHQLVITAEDHTGWSSTENVTFSVDTTPPMVELVGRDEESMVVVPPERIVWRVSEDLTGITSSSLRIDLGEWMEGEMVNSSRNQTFFSLVVDPPEGRHLLSFRGTNQADRSALLIVQSVFDSLPPLIDIQDIEDGGWYDEEMIIRYSVSDTVDIDPEVSATLDGVPYSGGKVGEGRHVLVVNAEDLAGNADRKEIEFFVDLSPPEVSVNLTEEIHRKPVRLSIEIQDDLDPSPELTANIDGHPYGGLEIGIGVHELEIVGRDKVGHTVTLKSTIVVDSTSPMVEVSVNNGSWHSEPLNVTVRSTDDLDGSPVISAVLDGTPFDTYVHAGEGSHLLEVSSRDWAGNSVGVEIAFWVDMTPPRIEVDGAADGGKYNRWLSPHAEVLDNVDDSPDVDWYLDGGRFEPGERVKDGRHVLSVRATDHAGNSAEVTMKFLVDTASPTIDANIEEGGEYRGSVSPEISIHDDLDTTYEAFIDGEPFEEGSRVGAGVHVLLIEAEDAVGNEAQRKIVFKVKRRLLPWLLGLLVVIVLLAAVIYRSRSRRRYERPTPQVYRFK